MSEMLRVVPLRKEKVVRMTSRFTRWKMNLIVKYVVDKKSFILLFHFQAQTFNIEEKETYIYMRQQSSKITIALKFFHKDFCYGFKCGLRDEAEQV